jgi:hypothetical protein
MKKNSPDTTKRRRGDMTPQYKPSSARHTQEPLGIVMGTWNPEEPPSSNIRDSALLHTLSYANRVSVRDA